MTPSAPDPGRPPRHLGGGGPAAHALVGCGLAMVVRGTVAALTGQAWLFPSLGPTAMLQIEQPGADGSSPRNTIVGHVVALAAGYLSLVVFGLTTAPAALAAGVDARRIGAAAVSLAATAAVLLLLRQPHPPAGATTLIVSLGLLRTPVSLLVALASVAVLTGLSWSYNRLSGDPMPSWAPRGRGPEPDRGRP